MTQIDVALTDFALTLLCSFFAFRLWMLPGHDLPRARGQRRIWLAFFLLVALGSLTGGTFHGFFEEPVSIGHHVIWLLTLLAIGGTASIGWILVSDILSCNENVRKLAGYFSGMMFVAYGLVVFFYSRSFFIAIMYYAPPMAVLLIASLRVYFKSRSPKRSSAAAWIAAGLAVSFVAAFVQQAQIAVHPTYFNHNSTFHAIQALGLMLIYFGAYGMTFRQP